MKTFVFVLGCVLLLGSLASAETAITELIDAGIPSVLTPIAPPPVEAMALLFQEGYLTDADIIFMWSLYDSPGCQDEEQICGVGQLIKELFAAARYAYYSYVILKACFEAIVWLNSQFTDDGAHFSGYPVPNVYGGMNY